MNNKFFKNQIDPVCILGGKERKTNTTAGLPTENSDGVPDIHHDDNNNGEWDDGERVCPV